MALPKLLRLLHSHRIAWFGLLMMVAAGGLFLVLAKQEARTMESRVFESLITSSSQTIEAGFDAFFAPVVDNLNIIRRWADKETITLGDDIESFNQRFIPILEQYPQMSALILATSNGNEYFLLNNRGDWLTRITRPEKWGSEVRWARWRSATELDEEWTEQTNYDPRSRPWFKGAMKLSTPGDRFWTAPYRFHTLKEPGITASTRTSSGDGGSMVIGIDVLLTDIGVSTTTTHLGQNGRVFALTHDDHILGPPKDKRFSDNPSALKKVMLAPVSSLEMEELSTALETWKTLGETLGKPFTFKIDKEVWWGVFRNFPRGERGFRIGYIIPQKDFSEEIGGGNSLFLWGGAGLVVFALLAFLLSFTSLRRGPLDINTNPAGAEPNPCTPERVQQLLDDGEGELVEFKSTLRWNLNNDKPGKEVEMSWLKTVVAFLNTNGGYLLIGVDDDSNILGIEADQFANEDKYLLHVNNLINQHIGLERSPYIRFSLVPVADSKILVVRCERSKTPAFLSIGKEEEFFIRTGPGSRKLPPSKIVAYLQERGD